MTQPAILTMHVTCKSRLCHSPREMRAWRCHYWASEGRAADKFTTCTGSFDLQIRDHGSFRCFKIKSFDSCPCGGCAWYAIRTHSEPSEVVRRPGGRKLNSMEMLAKAIDRISRNTQPKDNQEIRRFVAGRRSNQEKSPRAFQACSKWLVFFEHYVYEDSTGESNFSHGENMARLRKALKNRAREAFSTLLAIPDNVTNVMRTLRRRFERPDFIVQSLIEKAKVAQRRAQKLDLSNEGSNVVLDLVKAELRCSKAHSKPSIGSIGTSVSFLRA